MTVETVIHNSLMIPRSGYSIVGRKLNMNLFPVGDKQLI